MTIDPAISLMLRLSFVALFLWSALHKVRDFKKFRDAVSNYELLPPVVVALTAALIVLAEGLSIFIFALAPVTPSIAAIPIALLLLYGLSIGINLQRGRRNIDCGCVGTAGRSQLHGGLVIRNIVLAAFALIALLPVHGRTLVWVDGVSVGAATLVLGALYAAIDELLAHRPHRHVLLGVRHA